MATPPQNRRLSPHQHRALTLLDSLRDGGAEEFLLLCGFKREMLAHLVLAGLMTVVTETIQTGASTTKAERYYVTDAGRRAIQGKAHESPGRKAIEE